MTTAMVHSPDALWSELWASLGSLLRSYTVAHGLNGDRQAIVELSEGKIIVRHAKNWLVLERKGAQITWTRDNGTSGTLRLIEHGRLRGPNGEEELDMAAEAWARDLMQDQNRDENRKLTR